MAYTEQDRVFIREFLGFPAIYLQADPRLENAITATQSVADGGSRPDSTTENRIKSMIYGQASFTTGGFQVPARMGLLTLQASIDNFQPMLGATSIDGRETEIDAYRETARLKAQGRRLCQNMAIALGLLGVRMDAFGTPEIIRENPFSASGDINWYI